MKIKPMDTNDAMRDRKTKVRQLQRDINDVKPVIAQRRLGD